MPPPAAQSRPVAARRAGLPRAALPILLAGLLLRVWFILRFAHVAGDSLLYGDIARNLIQHHVYGFSPAEAAQPTLIRLPGYPLFLALCFLVFGMERYTLVLLVQAAVDLGTCLLLAALAARLFGERARMPALLLAALCPFTANYVAAPLTETLTLFSMTLAFYALARWQAARPSHMNRWAFVLGAALGYGLLLRPEQGLVAAALVPAMLWMARPLRSAIVPALAVSLLTLLPLAPWTARNWNTFHVFQPLAPRSAADPGEFVPTGFERWYRTWAVDFASTDAVYWNYDGAPIAIADLPTRAFDSQAQYAATAALLDDYNQDDNATPERDQRFDRIAAERITANPVRYYMLLPIARVVNMALRPRVEMLPVPLEWWHVRLHPAKSLFALAWAALNLAYLSLAAIGLSRRRWRPGQAPIVWGMLATVALRTLLLLTLDNSEPRYTLEFFPILIVLAAEPLSHLRRP